MTAAEILPSSVDFTLRLPFGLNSKITLWIILGIVSLVAAFFLFFIFVCLWERQYLAGDLEPASEPFPFPPTPYWTFTRQDALKLGWQHMGDFATKKNTTMVKGLLSLFLSPDGYVMAGIFSGATAGAKLHKTVLRSRLANNCVLESSDISGLSDPTGVLYQATLLNAGIAELAGFHAERLQKSGSTAVPFSPTNAIEQYEKMGWERGARWVQLGLARWADPQEESIRMTFRGALIQIKLLLARIRAMKPQQHRTHISRAGSRLSDR